MDAVRRSSQDGKVRMNYVENAIKRALAEVGDRYEAKMYWLATIVSEPLSLVCLVPCGGSWTPLEPWIAEANH